MLPSISRSNSNQTMKYGQLEYKKRNIFFKSHAENEEGRLLPETLF